MFSGTVPSSLTYILKPMHPFLTTVLQHKATHPILALLGGSFITLSLAPFNLWPFAFLSLAIAYFLQNLPAPENRPFFHGWLFGLGLYGSGMSWIYAAFRVSDTPVPLALIMIIIFCASIGLMMALQFKAHQLLKTGIEDSKIAKFSWVLFPLTWVGFEGLRSWLFSGLPWLFVGTSATENWLGAWLPLVGIYGTGLFYCLTIVAVFKFVGSKTSVWSACLLLIWVGGQSLNEVEWVEVQPDKVEAVALQGNIDQRTKWNRDQILPTFEAYMALTTNHLDADIIVWPEAAITRVSTRATSFLNELDTLGKETNTAIITGILTDQHLPEQGTTYWNSIYGLGNAEGKYHKTRMVPFGEYVPFDEILRGLFSFFDLPMSALIPGPVGLPKITWQNGQSSAESIKIGSLICYEIAYPELARQASMDSNLIITVSNDSWFGGSIGPHQHLQLARVRAMENGRPIIRATQDGMSAIIDYHGEILVSAPKFVRTAIRATLELTEGQTPYNRFGHKWLLYLIMAALASLSLFARFGTNRQA